MEEIVSTETTYISKLHILKTQFCIPLKDHTDLVDISALESQIQIISSYSQLLLSKLEKQLSEWNDDSTMIGNIFLQYIDFLKAYTQYVKYHSTIQKAIKEAKAKQETFKSLLEVCVSSVFIFMYIQLTCNPFI